MPESESPLELDSVPNDDEIEDLKENLLSLKVDLRERFRENAKLILKLGVAGIIIFGILGIFDFFNLTGSVHLFILAFVISIIVISLILMYVVLKDLHSDFKWIYEKALWAVNKMVNLVKGLKASQMNKFESFAHGLLMHEGPYTIDDYHYIEEISSTFDLTGEHTRFKEYIRGRNNTARESEEFDLYLETGADTNVSELDLEICQLKSEDGTEQRETIRKPENPDDPKPDEKADNKTWYAEPHGTFGVILHIPFLEPLKPMGHGGGASEFELEYSLVSGETPDDQNYQWLPSYRFSQGTDEITIRCELKENFYAEVGKIYDIEVDKSNISPAQLKSEIITEDSEMPELYSWPEDQKQIYKCEDKNADNSLYIFIIDKEGAS